MVILIYSFHLYLPRAEREYLSPGDMLNNSQYQLFGSYLPILFTFFYFSNYPLQLKLSFFPCLVATCAFSFMNCLFMFFAHFPKGGILFLADDKQEYAFY